VSVDWPLAAAVTMAAVLGSFAGGALCGRVPQGVLRRGFAWFVVVMAVFILVQEVPRALGAELELATMWPLVLGAITIPLALAINDLARRHRSAPA
jgi:uncharacterized membrane protein YfcA